MGGTVRCNLVSEAGGFPQLRPAGGRQSIVPISHTVGDDVVGGRETTRMQAGGCGVARVGQAIVKGQGDRSLRASRPIKLGWLHLVVSTRCS
jgi:hypothetical protein